MCGRCKDVDARIARYQGLAMHLTDQRMLDGIDKLIEQARSEKSELHPKEKK